MNYHVQGCNAGTLSDYYGCAFRVLAVFRQLLTHGQKFDR